MGLVAHSLTKKGLNSSSRESDAASCEPGQRFGFSTSTVVKRHTSRNVACAASSRGLPTVHFSKFAASFRRVPHSLPFGRGWVRMIPPAPARSSGLPNSFSIFSSSARQFCASRCRASGLYAVPFNPNFTPISAPVAHLSESFSPVTATAAAHSRTPPARIPRGPIARSITRIAWCIVAPVVEMSSIPTMTVPLRGSAFPSKTLTHGEIDRLDSRQIQPIQPEILPKTPALVTRVACLPWLAASFHARFRGLNAPATFRCRAEAAT